MALTGWSDTIFVEHGSAAELDDLNIGTAAFWLMTTSNTARQAICGKFQATTARGLALSEQASPSTLDAQVPRLTTNNTVQAQLTNFAHYAINKWLFVVWQWDTGTAAANNKLLVGDLNNLAAEPSAYDNQVLGAGSLVTDAAGNHRVGRHASAASRPFVGNIATHYLSNRLLTPVQIWQLQRFGTCYSPLLISAQYGLTSATAIQADLTGRGNNGTVTGTPKIAAHVPPMFVPRRLRYVVTSAAAAGGGGVMVNPFSGRGGAAAQPLAA